MAWTFESMMTLATGYWASAALSAGVELGLFERLDGPAMRLDELAEALGTAPRHTGELLNALTALGLLVRGADGRYALDPGAAPFLAPSGPTCLLDAFRFNIDLYPLWGRLASSVRDGAPAVPPSAHLGQDPARTRRFAMGMHSRALALAPLLLPHIDLEGCTRLLDVGAGPGTFSRRLAENRPGLQVTQFDLPPVLAVAGELAAASDLADRIALVPGNYRTDALPAPFDAVLYCGALHQETPETAADLFVRIREALAPGGRLYVVDLMLEAGRTAPAFPALFSITMMLTSPFGRVFEVPETEKLLRETGLQPERIAWADGAPYAIIRAVRP